MKKNTQISTGFARQFKHLASLLTVAIDRCPDELWTKQAKRTSGGGCCEGLSSPAQIAYHAVSTLAMGHMLNIPADQLPHDPGGGRIPSRKEVRDLLVDVSRHVARQFDGLRDEDILSREVGPGIRSLMYSLRHAHHNTGMLVQILKENGIKEPAWSSANMF